MSDRLLAHEGTMGKRFPSAHWLTMGLGGRIPPLLEALARSSVPQDFQRHFLASREGEQVAVRAGGRGGLRRATGDGDF